MALELISISAENVSFADFALSLATVDGKDSRFHKLVGRQVVTSPEMICQLAVVDE